jgi:two-component system OmpR family sensor kinase
MSLRARLLAGIVALVTVGLAVAALATYAEQRAFLYDRLDGQVAAAVGFVSARLASADPRADLFAGRGVNRRLFDHVPAGPRAGGRRPAAGDFLPPGTFGELLSPSHRIIGRPVSFTLSQARTAAVSVPAHFPVSVRGGRRRPFTFGVKGRGLRYRALALAVPSGIMLVAVPLREVEQTLQRLVLVEALVGLGVIGGILVLGWFVIRVGLRPLERIGATATEIAHGDLARRVAPASTRTEVGRLGLSLNDMLAQIEQAFADRTASEERLRRFLADASHELRTPLASIRGYAELYRLGAASDDAAVERSMGRIEAEAERMGGLVEDLLTLARLDELPVAERHPVDLSELAALAADDVRAMTPAHEVRFRGDGGQWVLADADQLRQVLANLLRNAVIHTRPGTLIELSVQQDAGRVVLAVRDHGPGLPEGAGDAVFERFWRSEGGRARGRGGAGLGLAIVKAIVLAHRGEVQADGPPGGGARFRVILPAAPSPHSGNAQAPPTVPIGGSATVSR